MDKNIMNDIKAPEFKNHKLTPRNPTCLAIDTTRLWVEILGGLHDASKEFEKSDLTSKLSIDGRYSLVIRYKREKNNLVYPACALSFNQDSNGNLQISQMQGSKEDRIAYRFHSSFNNISYYIELIEKSFSEKGIFVSVKELPEGIEGASYGTNAYNNYDKLRSGIMYLNQKYGLKFNK